MSRLGAEEIKHISDAAEKIRFGKITIILNERNIDVVVEQSRRFPRVVLQEEDAPKPGSLVTKNFNRG